ncbi:universal stress protein [Nocardia beijingensis]|uniref:universal stress protein n=1 Tax=Nocardia beijingensis TaxID=95162 RepID=UPI003F4E87B6
MSTATTHHALCPLAVIHGMSAIDPVTARQSVLVGVDGTDNSVPAVEFAFEEAVRRKVDVVALQAWSDTSGLDIPVRGWDAARESAEAVLESALRAGGALSGCHRAAHRHGRSTGAVPPR